MRRIGCIATILMTLALSMAVILLPKLEVHAEEVDVDAIKASIQEKQEQIEEAEKAKSKIKSNITNIQAMVSALEKEKGDLEAYVTKLDEDLTDVQEKIAERAEAKKAKDFARADALRDELLARGVAIKDTREGVVWELV